MTSDQALFLSELRGLACNIGPAIERCRREGQLSCAVRLNKAREELHGAIHSYNPGVDERQMDMRLNLHMEKVTG